MLVIDRDSSKMCMKEPQMSGGQLKLTGVSTTMEQEGNTLQEVGRTGTGCSGDGVCVLTPRGGQIPAEMKQQVLEGGYSQNGIRATIREES